MTRFVITPDAALHAAQHRIAIPPEHQLLAPTLFRSQALSALYRAVRSGELSRAEAEERLVYVRSLPMRLLGDRVLQNVAWKIAETLGWDDTLTAEYVALTQLQADALITGDPELARAVEAVVRTAPVEALTGRASHGG